jgi:hypothetical protein
VELTVKFRHLFQVQSNLYRNSGFTRAWCKTLYIYIYIGFFRLVLFFFPKYVDWFGQVSSKNRIALFGKKQNMITKQTEKDFRFKFPTTADVF